MKGKIYVRRKNFNVFIRDTLNKLYIFGILCAVNSAIYVSTKIKVIRI